MIFTENTSQFIIKTFKGRYISDHRAIVSELDIRIQHNIGKTVTFIDLKQINVEEFQSALDLGKIKKVEDLELIIENMRKNYQEF